MVGKQVRRSIATGQAIETSFVGDAVVVNRGEMVEVESVAGDVVVTTSGRASESVPSEISSALSFSNKETHQCHGDGTYESSRFSRRITNLK